MLKRLHYYQTKILSLRTIVMGMNFKDYLIGYSRRTFKTTARRGSFISIVANLAFLSIVYN